MKRDLPSYCYRRGRKGYIYYERGGTRVRLPDDPTSAEFYRVYAQLRDNRIFAPAKRNIKMLIASYMQSKRWGELAHNTRKSYMRSLRYFEEKVGHIDPGTIRRHHVIAMRDALAENPTTANRRVATFSVLMEHAIDAGWIDTNHAKGVSGLKSQQEPRTPWPVNMIEAFRAEADETSLLVFELLLGTGQRIGDVLKMQWGQIDGNGIAVKQGKTGAKLFVPFTDRVRLALEATPRRGLTIVTQPNGRPCSYGYAWKLFKAVRDRIGAERWDFHSLRHSAASELAAAGLDDQHIMAITGHSSADMVRLYAGPAAQKTRAIEAQKKRDGG